MATTTVTLPAVLVYGLVRNYTRAYPEYCIGSDNAIEDLLAEALSFALHNSETWLKEDIHAEA